MRKRNEQATCGTCAYWGGISPAAAEDEYWGVCKRAAPPWKGTPTRIVGAVSTRSSGRRRMCCTLSRLPLEAIYRVEASCD
jgi:hypothetical protein